MLKLILTIGVTSYLYAFDNFCDYLNRYQQNINILQTSERFHSDGFYGDSCNHILRSSLLAFDILYVEHIRKNGYFILNGQKFELTSHLNKNITLLPSRAGRNMNLLNSTGYIFKLQNKKYLCFIAGGLAEYQIGTNQRITFFSIFDITDEKHIKYFMLRSIYGCIRNIGDFNNDGTLDFLYTQYDNRENNNTNVLKKGCERFQITLLTLYKDNFVPVIRNGNPIDGLYQRECEDKNHKLKELVPLKLE